MTPLIAFDLSLTHTGWCRSEAFLRDYSYGVLEPKKLKGIERLVWLRDEVLAYAAHYEVVVIEGYSYGSPNQAHQLGELGGVVRVALEEAGKNIVIVPPSSLKTFATGRGNAGKSEMLTAAVQRLGYSGHQPDEVDALWLHAMIRYWIDGVPEKLIPKDHRRAFTKAAWLAEIPACST